MPSGAKKRRKAAKKKKTNGTQLHGEDDDLVVHDGKDSDGGDVSSPLSQHPDDDLHGASVGGDDDDDDKEEEEEEEEEEEDPSSVRSNVAVENEPLLVENGESTVKVTVEEEIPVENSEFENNSTNQDPEILENPSGGGGDDEDDSSSSSSSECSDDESHAIEKKKNIGMEDKIKAAFLELSNPVLLVEQKDEELAESPPLDLDLLSKPDDLPAEITQSKSVSDVTNVIDLETTPLTSDEPVEIAKVEILPILNNNNGEIILKENEIKVDKQVSTTVQETTTVTATVLPSSTVVSTAVTNNVNDQPQAVVITPKLTQRTSMASCCGLFELFTGSNR